MEITKEQIDDLNALIRIRVEEKDYAEAVEKAIKNLKNKITIPGFRPGMVPAGMIRKMYGKAVLSDEVSKITVEKLFRFLDENNIEYLGNPLPNAEKNKVDWDAQKEFEFYYDLGLSPKFAVVLPTDKKFTHYQIEADPAVVSDEVEKLRKRYGRSINAENVEENDMVKGTLTELNEDGSIKEGGLSKPSYIILDKIEDDATRQSLLGKKPGDEVIIDPRKAYKDNLTVSIYLGIKPEEVDQISNQFKLTIQSVSRLVPAEMDQEFFDRVFGKDVVHNEEEFRNKIADVLKFDLQQESNARLMNEIRNAVLAATQFDLPDNFLKRWIKVKSAEDKNFNPETVDDEYNKGREIIRWELIRKQVAEQNNIQVQHEEMMNEARRMVINRVQQMGYSLPDDRVDELANRLLTNNEERDKIITYIIEVKVLDYIKSQLNVVPEPISYNAFLEKLNASVHA
ncbi:MAG: trigger factor [Flavobacteriales bacterium]|nr:trigger factor [Flavobacteriales bacterium]